MSFCAPGTELPGSQHEQGAGPQPALPGAKTTLSFRCLCNPWPGLGGPGPGTDNLMARGRGFTGTVSWVVVGRGHGLRHRLSPPWPAEETSEPVQHLSHHIPTRLDNVSTRSWRQESPRLWHGRVTYKGWTQRQKVKG